MSGLLDRPLAFTEVSTEAGVAVQHGHIEVGIDLFKEMASGVACGDYDGDGWLDLYVVGGEAGRQHLFRNLGNGTFSDLAVDRGVDLTGEHAWGPAFSDIDGDGDLDLFVGGYSILGPALYQNQGDGTFSEVGRASAMFAPGVYISWSFGDYDDDGDLDLATTHWFQRWALRKIEHLWRNDGRGVFSEVPDSESGIVVETEPTEIGDIVWSFTSNFADMDGDGRLDLLLASDYGHSQVFANRGGGRFEDVSTPVLTDENGMGAAVGDYDNDGDLDWFVTSIFDASGVPSPAWGSSGNRLYRNDGTGALEDATEEAGVRDGSWGWGACAADFDNDGDLDLYHVNGWRDLVDPLRWADNPARLFLNRGNGTFVENAAASGVDDLGNGRGVACFDYDRDGDIDLFVSNVSGPTRLFRNDLEPGRSFLQVALAGRHPNTEGVGALLTLQAAGRRQIRHISSGNNYASQDPAVAHFGLLDAGSADWLEIRWPRGETVRIHGVSVNQHLVVQEVLGDANCDGEMTVADLLVEIGAGGDVTRRGISCVARDLNYDGELDDQDVGLVVDWLFDSRHAFLGRDGPRP